MALRLGGGELIIRRALGTPAAVQGFRLFGSPLYGARLASPVAGTVLLRAGDGALSLRLLTGITADLNVTLADATLAADGTIGAAGITGDLSATLAPATLASTGTVANGASGDLAVTLAPATLVSDATITQPGITADLAVTLQDATLAASGTVPASEQTRGGFYTKEDRKRLARLAELQAARRDQQRDEQDTFRNALGAAYDAALGLVDEPAAETRAEVREAIAEAAQTAPEPYRAEVQRLRDLARQAETLAQIERMVTRIAAIQARAEADADDDDAMLMLMG